MIPCITTIKFHIYTKIIIERKTSYYVKFSRALHKLSFFFFFKDELDELLTSDISQFYMSIY